MVEAKIFWRTFYDAGPWRSVLFLFLLPGIGTLGFQYIEGWNWFDALYMSVITLSTVGFGEVHPLSNEGRAFVICFMALGLGSFLFALTQVGSFLAQSGVSQMIKQYTLRSKLTHLKDHYLICGFGRMGMRICDELCLKNQKFVVIEKNAERLEHARKKGFLAIDGEATDDSVLCACNIAHAKGLCAVLSADADNLLLVLSARLLNPNIHIVARALEEANVKKLEQAGAAKVVSLYHISALKVVETLVNPNFLDVSEIGSVDGFHMDMAELLINEESHWVGKQVADLPLQQFRVLLAGVHSKRGKLLMPVPVDTTICSGDALVLVGSQKSIAHLMKSLSI